MMVVDTSALIALLLGEPQVEQLAAALESSAESILPAPNAVEAFIVAEARLGPQGALNLQRIMGMADIRSVPFDAQDAEAAIEAWRRYGKGRHPAGLNLGDCYSYAMARRRASPLLYVGEDFAKTDVQSAL